MKPIVGFAKTTKVTVTSVAAANVMSPPWEATMVQLPTVLKVTKTSFTVQTDVVDEVNETGKPELADALTVSGEAVMLTLPCVKEIV